jgi:hypothetical protein
MTVLSRLNTNFINPRSYGELLQTVQNWKHRVKDIDYLYQARIKTANETIKELELTVEKLKKESGNEEQIKQCQETIHECNSKLEQFHSDVTVIGDNAISGEFIGDCLENEKSDPARYSFYQVYIEKGVVAAIAVLNREPVEKLDGRRFRKFLELLDWTIYPEYLTSFSNHTRTHDPLKVLLTQIEGIANVANFGGVYAPCASRKDFLSRHEYVPYKDETGDEIGLIKSFKR